MVPSNCIELLLLPAFSRDWRQFHIFASNSDWLVVLFTSVAIGQSNYFWFYDTQFEAGSYSSRASGQVNLGFLLTPIPAVSMSNMRVKEFCITYLKSRQICHAELLKLWN